MQVVWYEQTNGGIIILKFWIVYDVIDPRKWPEMASNPLKLELNANKWLFDLKKNGMGKLFGTSKPMAA